MTAVVWKYEIPIQLEESFMLVMPRGARLLTVQEQRGRAQLWALCDPNRIMVPRHFIVLGTGIHTDAEAPDTWVWVGTLQQGGERAQAGLVFHVFETPRPEPDPYAFHTKNLP